jgi:hypothetical protein
MPVADRKNWRPVSASVITSFADFGVPHTYN